MLTNAEYIQSLNAYPIPDHAIETILQCRGLTPEEEFTAEIAASRDMLFARADTYLWLSYAPSVTQGGISYSFTDADRLALRARATSIYTQEQEQAESQELEYGYKGERL